MGISLNVPDFAEAALREAWGADLGRVALEALVSESYRQG